MFLNIKPWQPQYFLVILYFTNTKTLIMANTPSYNGIGSSKRVNLRTTPSLNETSISTQRPATTTPSPRGHA